MDFGGVTDLVSSSHGAFVAVTSNTCLLASSILVEDASTFSRVDGMRRCMPQLHVAGLVGWSCPPGQIPDDNRKRCIVKARAAPQLPGAQARYRDVSSSHGRRMSSYVAAFVIAYAILVG
eukprot:gnl/TRDRNA2_/TRDRNA2_157634_c0_seq1.p2 gnl/TRDRNA2_/TRDRNA2_157634_c0~~gnl/TRDRNA2_/TRDRNA2_157634_c0_seq1.p2  ORF type:complete len:120 (-),score=7.96 gnl/TRDRNA2_/TRDRNA2_157634_c0_seq1:298-657(-)